MLTLNQAIKQLNNIADSHSQVNSFFFGEMYDFASSGVTKYPAMAVSLLPSNLATNNLTYSFDIYLMDLVHKDISNRQEVLSDMQQIALDIIATLDRTVEFKFSVDTNVTLTDFVDRFDDEVAGYQFALKLKVLNPLDRCAVPLSSVVSVITPMADGVGSTLVSSLYTSLIGAWNANNSMADAYGSNTGTRTTDNYTTAKIGSASFSVTNTNTAVKFSNNSWNYPTFSISLWMYKTSASTRVMMSNIATSDGVSLSGWVLQSGTDGKISFIPYNNTSITTVTGSVVTAINTWAHVVITNTTSVGRSIYINGVLDATVSESNNINYTYTGQNSFSFIGGYCDTNDGASSSNFNGRLDAVAFWNKALSQTEITDLYNTGTGKEYPY